MMGGYGRFSTSSATVLLLRWKSGDSGAVNELLPIVYDELRRLAQGIFTVSAHSTRYRARPLCTKRICV